MFPTASVVLKHGQKTNLSDCPTMIKSVKFTVKNGSYGCQITILTTIVKTQMVK